MLMNVFSKAKEMAFEALFSLLPINFSWIDREGFLLGCNQYVLDYLGLPDFNSVVGKHTSVIASYEAWENTKKVILSGESMTFEEIHFNCNGGKIYFLSMKSPIKSSDGRVVGVVNIAIDISSRKLIEMELEHEKNIAQSANRAKTEFLLNMRHDIRTPFCGIIGISENLEFHETDIDKKEQLRDIITCSSSLLDILNETLTYIDVESGRNRLTKQEFDLHHILEDIYNMMKPSAIIKLLDFTFAMDENLPRFLMGDPLCLKRIIINVLSNSVKFTHKGHIKVFANFSLKNDINGVLEVYIEDTGIGIPEDKKEIIFEKFTKLTPSYTGEYHGCGLGLSLVKQSLENIGGQYNITTALGKGTTFKLYIPYELPLLP